MIVKMINSTTTSNRNEVEYFIRYYERITHVSSLVVESQGTAGEKADEGEAGGTHQENELVIQVVKHNRLKGGCGWV